MAKLIIQQLACSPTASFNHLKVPGKVPCPRGHLGSRGPKEGWHRVTSRGGIGHLSELCWPQSPCPAAVTDCSTLSLAVQCLYFIYSRGQELEPGSSVWGCVCCLPCKGQERAHGALKRAAAELLNLAAAPTKSTLSTQPQSFAHDNHAQPHALGLNKGRSHPISP